MLCYISINWNQEQVDKLWSNTLPWNIFKWLQHCAIFHRKLSWNATKIKALRKIFWKTFSLNEKVVITSFIMQNIWREVCVSMLMCYPLSSARYMLGDIRKVFFSKRGAKPALWQTQFVFFFFFFSGTHFCEVEVAWRESYCIRKLNWLNI